MSLSERSGSVPPGVFGDDRSRTTCTVWSSAERGGEGAVAILSVGGEGEDIFWSRRGAVFWGDAFGGESSGGFRGASGFEAIS